MCVFFHVLSFNDTKNAYTACDILFPQDIRAQNTVSVTVVYIFYFRTLSFLVITAD